MTESLKRYKVIIQQLEWPENSNIWHSKGSILEMTPAQALPYVNAMKLELLDVDYSGKNPILPEQP